MSKPENSGPELKLSLTEQQREQLVRFISDNRHGKLDIDIEFEANVAAKTLAPVAVLVGNAI